MGRVRADPFGLSNSQMTRTALEMTTTSSGRAPRTRSADPKCGSWRELFRGRLLDERPRFQNQTFFLLGQGADKIALHRRHHLALLLVGPRLADEDSSSGLNMAPCAAVEGLCPPTMKPLPRLALLRAGLLSGVAMLVRGPSSLVVRLGGALKQRSRAVKYMGYRR